MYKITCCRLGKWNIPNRHHRGPFIKEFNTLSKLSKFIVDNQSRFFYPNIKKELTRKEFRIVITKINSIHK
jgi:hypothetical protein